jgi:hypothetical protein
MLRCGNIVLLTVRFLDVTKFTTPIPLSLLISCKLSFSIVDLKIASLPTLGLKSPKKNVHMVFREVIEHTFLRSCAY